MVIIDQAELQASIKHSMSSFIRVGSRIEKGRLWTPEWGRPPNQAIIDRLKVRYGISVYFDRSYQIADFLLGRKSVTTKSIDEFRKLRDIDPVKWKKYENALKVSKIATETGACEGDYPLCIDARNYNEIIEKLGLLASSGQGFFMTPQTISQIPIGLIHKETMAFPKKTENLRDMFGRLGLNRFDECAFDLTVPEIGLAEMASGNGVLMNLDMFYKVDPKKIEEIFALQSRKLPILEETANYIQSMGICPSNDVHAKMISAGITSADIRNEILSLLETACITSKHTASDVEGVYYISRLRELNPIEKITPIKLAITAVSRGPLGREVLNCFRENIGRTLDTTEMFTKASIKPNIPDSWRFHDFQEYLKKFVRCLDIGGNGDLVVIKGGDIKTASSIMENVPRSEVYLRINNVPELTLSSLKDSREELKKSWVEAGLGV